VALPFALGAALPVDAVLHGPDVCPFQAITGVPCPLCGATRAFVLAGHLDARWLDYGAVWVLAAVALLVVRPRVWMVAATFAIAWAWALAHTSTIVG
jgi:hypothetical protein